ncbi:sialidase family protein [Mucilaginibacter psychrotolerans]|uniref:Sialidase n=1 Tax=Mucilaginibacter psychrotolerans TaxID=1524096 RepID=A0A4Y8SJT1_9SPHI|nr:sialidase family protein [Mucilaginibacter psychrotolerans]TFF38910.1 sialidase [Mucilaginibacter psychrotolerans]
MKFLTINRALSRVTAKLLLLCALSVLIFANASAQADWEKVKTELVFDAPPFAQCHASTIVETKKGELLIACFGGSAESRPDVSIWLKKLGDASEGPKPVMIADGVIDSVTRYPTWNPVLFKLKTSRLFLFYKVGPNPREWWGMVKTSDDNGLSWSVAKALPKGILGPIKNKPIQLADGSILSPSSIEENNGRWKVHIERSVDNGASWANIQVDTAGKFDVIQPSILKYKNGSLQLLCRSKQGTVVQAWSYDKGKTWGTLSTSMLLNPNSGTDAVTLKSGRQLIVYNPDVPGKEWYNGRSKLRVACSTDGSSWRDVAVLEDGTTEEYSYPAIIQTKDGLIHITYTFNRKNIKHVVLKEGN